MKMRKSKKFLVVMLAGYIVFLLAALVIAETVKKDTTTITPISSFQTTQGGSFAGQLERIVLKADGNDTAFTFAIKDQDGITLYSKTDCNTLDMPYSFILTAADSVGTAHRGIPFCGSYTIDTNNIGTSEQQTLSIASDANDPNGGTFQLSFAGYSTAQLAYDANGSDITAALCGLSPIGLLGLAADSDSNNITDGNSVTLTFAAIGDQPAIGINTGYLIADTNDAAFTATNTELVKGTTIRLDAIIYYLDDK